MNSKLFIAFLFKESDPTNIGIASSPLCRVIHGEVRHQWVKILLFLRVQTCISFPLSENRPNLQATCLFLCRRYVYKQICGCLYIMEQFRWERWMHWNIWIFANKCPDRDLVVAVNLPVKNSLCYACLLLWSWKMEWPPPAPSDLDSERPALTLHSSCIQAKGGLLDSD